MSIDIRVSSMACLRAALLAGEHVGIRRLELVLAVVVVRSSSVDGVEFVAVAVVHGESRVKGRGSRARIYFHCRPSQV